MTTIFDYLKWRGDLSFSDIRPCAADSMMLAMMSYVDYAKLCGGEEKTLRDAAALYCANGKYDSVNLGLIMPSKQINRLFCEAGKSKRFGSARITDFDSRTDDREGYQFCAVTYHFPGKQMMVIFRGTDDSIAGWREDCMLSFLDEIPAQRMAVEYLEAVAQKYPDEKIYTTGHSKGGNLAVYAAVNSSDAVRARIVRAYSHDGPGFSMEMIKSEKYRRMQRKLSIIVPQSSYIGIMFEKGEKYTVIKCRGKGIFQHDPFQWEFDGPDFLKLPKLSRWGENNEKQFRAGMNRMTADEKREFVETFFQIVDSTGAKTLTEFSSGSLKKLITAIKAYKGLDKAKREMMLTILLRLFDLKRDK